MKIILHQKDFPYQNGGFLYITRISDELSKNNIQPGNGFPKNRKSLSQNIDSYYEIFYNISNSCNFLSVFIDDMCETPMCHVGYENNTHEYKCTDAPGECLRFGNCSQS